MKSIVELFATVPASDRSAPVASLIMRTDARQRQRRSMILAHLLTPIWLVALGGMTAPAQPVFPLFDQSNQTIQWVPASTGLGPILWTVADGTLQVAPGRG